MLEIQEEREFTTATLKSNDFDVSVSVPSYGLTIFELWDLVLRPTLLAAGYQPSTLDKFVEPAPVTCCKSSSCVGSPT